jgi:hypothetical protein
MAKHYGFRTFSVNRLKAKCSRAALVGWGVALALWLWGGGLAISAVAASLATASHPLSSFWGDQFGGDQLNYASYMARGENIFTNLAHYPMLNPNTPGLFPLLLVPFVWLFGPSLLYGNLLGVACLLTTLGATAYVARKASRSWVAVPISWGILLGMHRVGSVLSWNRPDSLAAALTALSIAFLVRHEVREQEGHIGRGDVIVAALFGVLAAFAKQLALPIMVGTVLYFALRRRWKALSTYVAVAAVSTISIVAVAMWFTAGGYLYSVWTLTYAMTTFSFIRWFSDCCLYSVGNLTGLVLLGFGVWTLRTSLSRVTGLLTLLATVTIIAGAATRWDTAGSLQYFVYGTVALAMAGGPLALGYSGKGSASIKRLCILFAALAFAQPAINRVLPWRTLRESWTVPWHISRPDLAKTEKVFHETAGLQGEVFFDRLTGLAVLQGRPVQVEISVLGVLRARNLWNGSDLCSDFLRQRWDYVVVLNRAPGVPLLLLSDSELDAAVRRRYRLLKTMPLDSPDGIVTPEVQIWQSELSQARGASPRQASTL